MLGALLKDSEITDKLQFIGQLNVVCLEVSLKPFQRLVGAAAIGGRPPQRAK